jgi:LAO/AO transport system kinase
MPTLAERVLAGEPRAVARAISLIEDEDPASADLVARIFSRTGRAYLIGVTGPPGAGKSTLVDRLVTNLRTQRPQSTQSVESSDARLSLAGFAGAAFPLSVGVIAVDPTSPFSGGAVLGDRLRMQAHAADENVFIRSMATRGHLGGLARSTGDAALVLDASGKDAVIIETVGVGQDEVDIIRTADISIVTLVPGTGDDVQALKAGIMEIADIFVINKADREGADRLVSSVESNLSLHSYGSGEWRPPVLKTVATSGVGVPELVAAIAQFRAHSNLVQASRRRTRSEFRLRELVSHRFMDHLEQKVLAAGELGSLVDRIAARELDPYTAANELLVRALQSPNQSPNQSDNQSDNQSPNQSPNHSPTQIPQSIPQSITRLPDYPITQSMKAILDHIGIAVKDLNAALAFYRDALGLEIEAPEDVASQRVRAHFVPVGEAKLELLEATAEDSPIAKYVDKRGPGLHHITLRVDDIEAALAQLKAHGARLIDEHPRPGAEGSLVAFVHPASAHGVLVELKQITRP